MRTNCWSCRNHNFDLFSFMIYHRNFDKTRRVPSIEQKIPTFWMISVQHPLLVEQSLFFWICSFFLSWYFLSHTASDYLYLQSVNLWHTASDYLFSVILWHTASDYLFSVILWHTASDYLFSVILWHTASDYLLSVILWHTASDYLYLQTRFT